MEMATILLFALPVLVGALLLYVAAWARRKNVELNAADQTTPTQAIAAWRSGRIKRGFEIYYLGNLPDRHAKVGRALSVLVVILVSVSLVALIIAVLGR